MNSIKILIALIISTILAIVCIHTKDIWFNYILEYLLLDSQQIEETIKNSELKNLENKIDSNTVFDYSPKLQEIMDNIFIICKKGYKFAVYSDKEGSHIIQIHDTDDNGKIVIIPCKEMNKESYGQY